MARADHRHRNAGTYRNKLRAPAAGGIDSGAQPGRTLQQLRSQGPHGAAGPGQDLPAVLEAAGLTRRAPPRCTSRDSNPREFLF